MAVIDPEGLFNGDRFEMISDQARLMWPFLWCASNSCGRIELNYRKVVGHAFSRFKKPPTEQEFWGWIQEYFNAWLLFVYEVNGCVWGQWDTSAKYLPKYQLTQDKATPAPDYEAITKWKNEYIALKREKNQCKSICISNSGKVPPSFRTDRYGEGIGVGVGVGVGVGEEKATTPPTAPQGGQEALFDVSTSTSGESVVRSAVPTNGNGTSRRRPAKRTTAQLEAALGQTRLPWWVAFWKVYPCKEGKRDAMEAFEVKVTTREIWDRVMAGAARYAELLARQPDRKPKYGQGWLNSERFLDEAPQTAKRNPFEGL